MATLPDLYQHLLTGRNQRITNKRYNVSKVVNGFTMIDPNYSTNPMYQEGIELSKQAYKLYEEGLELPEDSPESSAKIHESAKLYKDALRKLHRYEYDVLSSMKRDVYYREFLEAFEQGANNVAADRQAKEKANQVEWKLPIKVPQSKKITNAIRDLQRANNNLFSLSPISPRRRRNKTRKN
jgi:hypothetical protein